MFYLFLHTKNLVNVKEIKVHTNQSLSPTEITAPEMPRH